MVKAAQSDVEISEDFLKIDIARQMYFKISVYSNE